jgi:Protein of unknown function (DUF5661)
MRKVSITKAKKIADKLGIDLDVVPIEEWKYGMEVELEHGKRNKKTNVTNDDLLMTGKIALAHILEYPDYYPRLYKMEKTAENYWKGKKKPSILKK